MSLDQADVSTQDEDVTAEDIRPNELVRFTSTINQESATQLTCEMLQLFDDLGTRISHDALRVVYTYIQQLLEKKEQIDDITDNLHILAQGTAHSAQ